MASLQLAPLSAIRALEDNAATTDFCGIRQFHERCIRAFYLKARWIAVCVAATSHFPAFASDQLTAGTIVVVAQTQSRIIVAADSRLGFIGPDGVVTRTEDNGCKITTPKNRLVFTSAGIFQLAKANWSAFAEADAAVTRVMGVGGLREGDLDKIATNWGLAMQQHLRALNPVFLSGYVSKNGDNALVIGLFAGSVSGKTVVLRGARINYAGGAIETQLLTLNSNDPPTAYYHLGKSEIALEFNEFGNSPRAQRELAAWKRRQASGAAFDRFKTRRLVELTIMHHIPKADVGGPIDEIELDSRGSTWIQVKPNCK